jgi:hypothetical protein
MSRVDEYGLARQSSGRGTPNATMQYWPPVETVEVRDQAVDITVEETIGNRFPAGLDYGTRFFSITPRGVARFASLPRILSGFLGQPDAGAAVSGVYPQVFDPAAAGKIPEWHSMYVVRNDPLAAATPGDAIIDLFTDCRGEQLDIDVEANNYLRFAAQFYGLLLDDDDANPTSSIDTSSRVKFPYVSVFLDDGGGEEEVKCRSWGLTYTNGHDTDQAILGSTELYDLPYGNANCQIRFQPRDGLSAHYRRALETEPESVKIRMIADNGLAAGSRLAFEWIAYAMETVEAPADVNAAEVLKMINVTGRVKYSAGDSKFIQATVNVPVATY